MATNSGYSTVGFEDTIVCAAGVNLIRRNDANGIITFITTSGVVVATPASYTIGFCEQATIESHMFNIAAGGTWTPANIPAGKVLVGLAMSVIGATGGVTDADGTVITLLPAGYSASWNTDEFGVLVPPRNISAVAATGRVVVIMSVR